MLMPSFPRSFLRRALLTAACTAAAMFPVAAQAQTGGVPADDLPVWQYTVRPGDTLIALAQRYLRDPARWPVVQRDNHIANPRHIPPGTVLRIPASLLRQQPSAARLVQAFGTVRWRAQPADPWQTATAGQTLAAGAQVQAADDGSAVIELANGTRLALQPGSTLGFDTLSLFAGGLMADTRLRLQQGQVDIQDNPQRLRNQNLRILTPSAQAVVRGTEFRLAAAADATREQTLDGAVALQAAGQQVRVGAGMGSLARAGQPPLPPVPLLPAPDVAALPDQFEQLPLRFVWPPQPGAVAWFGQVTAADHAAHVLRQKTVQTPVFSVADLPNGRYTLRLRAIDANGLQGFDATRSFTVFARPFFPLLTTPAAAAVVRVPRPELSWSAVLGVTATRLQLSATADFTEPLYDVTVHGAQWRPPADLPAGSVFWRAASLDAHTQQGPWSPPQQFRYLPGPGPADLSKAAIRFDAEHLWIDLPAPPAGQHYALTLSAHPDLRPALAQADGTGGPLALARPAAGKCYLGARLVDDSDGTAGPPVVQAIDVPPRYPYLWLLLIPLLPAL